MQNQDKHFLSCTKCLTKIRNIWNSVPFVWWKSFNTFSTSQKTGCQWLITSALPWCCCRWLLAACPAILRAGGCKRTCFPCRCPCAYIRHNRFFCLVFSRKFNIITALSAHQSLTLPQKNDSREGLFWCNERVVCACWKMNFYLERQPFAPFRRLFAAKCGAFWC